ncbi:hypothetical protein [Nostoc sp. NOS(2021)]|nr:hypothetical protein [Nostoc sp. NOS(2021)]
MPLLSYTDLDFGMECVEAIAFIEFDGKVRCLTTSLTATCL